MKAGGNSEKQRKPNVVAHVPGPPICEPACSGTVAQATHNRSAGKRLKLSRVYSAGVRLIVGVTHISFNNKQPMKAILCLYAVTCLWRGSLLADTVVVPNILANQEGSASQIPDFTGGLSKWQQFYSRNQFQSLSPSGGLITAVMFRSDGPGADTTTQGTFSDFEVRLSTTSRDSLSPAFAQNPGPDETICRPRGPLAWLAVDKGAVAGPESFSIVIPLPTPFYYDPRQGNLLLDMRSYAGSSPGGPVFDFFRTVEGSSFITGGLNDTQASSGVLPRSGLVTEFQFTQVPESSSLFSLGAVVCLFAGFFKRKSRTNV